jgi:hypothetical protein
MAYTPPTTTTKRGAALAEAASLGINTEGMSTRDAKEAITETRAAQKDMAEFINKVLDSRPALQVPAPATVQATRTVEDVPSTISRTSSGDGGGNGNAVPIEFYTWIEGKIGTVTILCLAGPSPLE